MTVSVAEVRKIMGKAGDKYTDSQLEDIIRNFIVLSDIIIDSYLIKRKEKKNGKS